MKRCTKTPAYRSAGACEAAIATRALCLPAGTRGQSEPCRCGKWHIVAVPLTDVGRLTRPQDLEAVCLRKTRYATEGAAVLSALRRPVALRVYPCPYCAGYHLTKQVTYDDA